MCPPSAHGNLGAIQDMEQKRRFLAKAADENREAVQDIIDKRLALTLVIALQSPEKLLQNW